ncbi:MAG TPA: hypothetical protein V6C76_07490 [Drouetiella sp.]
MEEAPKQPLVIEDDPRFVLPRLVDDQLAAELVLRGMRERKALTIRVGIYTFIGAVVGAISVLVHVDILPLLFLSMFLSALVGRLLANQVERAMRRRQHDRAARLLPNATYWTCMLSPFAYFSQLRCLQMQVNLILLEGRYTELEIVSLYAKGYNERVADPQGVPKNWAIANNLAIAHMQQGRYKEGAEMFQAALANAKEKRQLTFLHSNLSFCQMRLGQISEAVENNKIALALTGREAKTQLGCLVLAIEALLKSKCEQFDEAEKLVEELRSKLSAKQTTPDVVITRECTMAEIRWRQKRYDEAKLYFHNGLDLLKSADNPNYYVIVQLEREYAQCLEESGDLKGAEKALLRAEEYFNFYLKRELDAIDLVRSRLANGKSINYAAQLLDLSHRSHYIPSIEFQRDFDLIDDHSVN